MADTPKVYVICDANCRWEGMTKEQILTAIMQAVQSGSIGDVDTGFITTVKTINGKGLKFFVGEQHEYEALTAEQKDGLFAIITNDTTKEGILAALEAHTTKLEAHSATLAEQSAKIADWENGAVAIPKAKGLSLATTLKVDYKFASAGASDVLCDLEANTVYLVSVRDKTTSRIVTNFILPIGDLSLGENWASTIGGDSLKAFYIYRGWYLRWASGKYYFNLGRADISSSTSSERNFQSVTDFSNHEIIFAKIADYPI